MTSTPDSWTHRLARIVVRPLVGTAVSANHLTTARLVTGVAACVAIAVGARSWEIWGGVLWVLSAFLDRADGELARLGNTTSAGGHAYDYACDVMVNGLVFAAIGVGQRHGVLGGWAVVGGVGAGACVVAASLLCEALEKQQARAKKAYVGAAGFDFDDILYLFGPLAWFGWLFPLLIGATVGAPIFAVVTYVRLAAARTR